MRLSHLLAACSLAVGCSGEGNRSKEATVACWTAFAEIGRTTEAKLGENASGLQIAAAYREVADDIDRLPLLDVDPDLTRVLSKFSRDLRELGAVYHRLSTRREDIHYGLNKVGESFLRGLIGDPFGTTRDEIDADKADKVLLDESKAKLRADWAELSSLRGKLTARYHVEFPLAE